MAEAGGVGEFGVGLEEALDALARLVFGESKKWVL